MLLYILVLLILFLLYQQSDFISEVRAHYLAKELKDDEDIGDYPLDLNSFKQELQEKNKEIVRLKQEKKQLDGTINNFKNRNLPMGEEMAYRDLKILFHQFKEDKKIWNYKIYNNLLFTDNGRVSQLDHLVICDYGVFMIETKTWRGDIFYNVSKDYLEKNGYALLNRYLFNESHPNKKEYRTFVIKPDEGIEVQDYGHPFNQVMTTIKHVQPIFNDYVFINGLIYFNYKDESGKYLFEDGSSEKKGVQAVHNKEELEKYLLGKIESKDRIINRKTMDRMDTQLKENTIQAS